MTQKTLSQPALAFWAAVTAAPSRYGLLVLVTVLFLSPLASAEELTTGSSARKLRNEVVQQVPWAQLNAETKAKISDVMDKPNMYRSLPRMAIQIDPEYLQFLIRHPEVVVNIWELMGITEMTATRVGPFQLKTDDGAGTVSYTHLTLPTNREV